MLCLTLSVWVLDLELAIHVKSMTIQLKPGANFHYIGSTLILVERSSDEPLRCFALENVAGFVRIDRPVIPETALRLSG